MRTEASSMEPMPMGDLKDVFFTRLDSAGLSAGTVNNEKKVFSYIERFMLDRGINAYTDEIGDLFIKQKLKERSYSNGYLRMLKAVARHLDSIVKNEDPQDSTKPKEHYVPDCFKDVYNDYVAYVSSYNMKNTVVDKKRYSALFFSNLEKAGCRSVAAITPEAIGRAYLMNSQNSRYPTSMRDVLK